MVGLRVVLVALLVAGCTADPVAETGESARPSGAPTTPTIEGAARGPSELREVDLGRVPPDGTVTVHIGPGIASFLFSAVNDDLDAELAINDVVGPDGKSAVPEASLLDNPAEVSTLVTSRGGLRPGRYEVELATSVETRASVVLKPVAAARQVLDVRLWDATKKGRISSALELPKAEGIVRRRGEETLAKVGLGVGSIAITRAPAPVVTSSARLRLPSSGTERRLRELCRAMSTGLGPARTLNIVVIDEILDRTQKDTELFGAAAAVPGAAFVPGSSTSCAAVAIGGDGGMGAQATTVWHEAGHLLGLFHTTEEDGLEWDPIDDTPRCTPQEDTDRDDYLAEDECAALDGSNLMFHDTNQTVLTPGQAALLRAHPLFRAP